MADLYLALLHYPVYDKTGAVVTTAVTNLDVHDLARLSRTFGVRAFYVCTPIETLQRLVARIIRHWEVGPGATYNATRREALALVRQAPELDDAIADIERETGHLPRLVATTARAGEHRLGHDALRARLAADGPPELLILGTGWGLTADVLARADDVLEPIQGTGSYNHLSVRAAAAIMLDRLRAGR
jgi:hypothetical protein